MLLVFAHKFLLRRNNIQRRQHFFFVGEHHNNNNHNVGTLSSLLCPTLKQRCVLSTATTATATAAAAATTTTTKLENNGQVDHGDKISVPSSSSSSSSSLSDGDNGGANTMVEQHKVSHTQRTTSSRSRRRTRSGKNDDKMNIPSYKEFVHRFTVLSLYRNYLKTIRDMIPQKHGNHDDLKTQVRNEFKSSKTLIDPYTVQIAIKEGKRRYIELQEFTGANKKYDGDSWLSIQDPDDQRGRVGQGWPWEQ